MSPYGVTVFLFCNRQRFNFLFARFPGEHLEKSVTLRSFNDRIKLNRYLSTSGSAREKNWAILQRLGRNTDVNKLQTPGLTTRLCVCVCVTLFSRIAAVIRLLSHTQWNMKEVFNDVCVPVVALIVWRCRGVTSEGSRICSEFFFFYFWTAESFLRLKKKKNTFHLLSFPLLSACWGCYYGTLQGHR